LRAARVEGRTLKTRGFTLIELAVVVVAIGLLAGLAVERLLPLFSTAERIAFMQVRAHLQSALLLETADRITRGESRTLAAMSAGNPMDLLLKAPANYLGVMAGPGADGVPARHWYYDSTLDRLVYRVGSLARFDGLDGPRDRIELTVRLDYRDWDDDGVFDAQVDDFRGIQLEAVHPFAWPE
jgi:prepilin-type N-terminal cleavage/methylation domain-containing protein